MPLGALITVNFDGNVDWADPAQFQIVGYTGSAGDTGYMGSTGISETGYSGSIGATGYNGSAGFTGSVGAAGPGYTGSIGSTGYTGSLGTQGLVGYQGSIGGKGTAGDQGQVGFQGSVGDTGYTGSAGSINITDLLDVPNTLVPSSFLTVNAAGTGIVFDTNTYITNTMVTDVNFASYTLFSPVMMGYGERIQQLGNVGVPGINIDLTKGNLAALTLTDDVVAIVLNKSNLIAGTFYGLVLFVSQDGNGNRTIDWSNQTILWPKSENVPSTGPVLSTSATYIDLITLYTYDGGNTWYGVMSVKGWGT